jgi:tryptophan synthase alpha chain
MKKLNIYFTAGCPNADGTLETLKLIQAAGAHMIELGMPYSDPVADGPIIQKAHEKALANGMSIERLFEQLKDLKSHINIPVILMGYINPVLSFGFERFCQLCQQVGISGLIIPDLPPYEFEQKYQALLAQYGLNFTFLVTPETSVERIHYLDGLSSGFLYAVSSSSTTGNNQKQVTNEAYLQKLASLDLKNPLMIGFGIKNKQDFDSVSQYADGAIVGTAFVNILLENTPNWAEKASDFVKSFA